MESFPSYTSRLLEIAQSFGKLGLTCFGGPVAHIGYFRAEFVQKRKWMEDAAFTDLVALCQFLPGPASSQVVFAIGMQRAGFVGAMLGSALFMIPSIVLMIAFAYGVAWAGDLQHAGWLHGLKLAAVAVVGQAVWGMGKNLCTDWQRIVLALACAALLLTLPGAAIQVGVIAMGAIVGWLLYRKSIESKAELNERASFRTHIFAMAALLLFFVLLIVLPIVAAKSSSRAIDVFDSFYRSGALVFGGGHVVLPLLRAEVVPRHWLTDDQFLAGYGAAQAVPGPLFTFSAYLGTAMSGGRFAWLNGLWCVLAIFLPALLLIGGALPFWHRLRSKSWAQAGLRGANAAVVGILFAALCRPVISESVHSIADAAAALVALALLQWIKTPPWLVVLLMAATGQWLLR